jgi:hypothetical protein
LVGRDVWLAGAKSELVQTLFESLQSLMGGEVVLLTLFPHRFIRRFVGRQLVRRRNDLAVKLNIAFQLLNLIDLK